MLLNTHDHKESALYDWFSSCFLGGSGIPWSHRGSSVRRLVMGDKSMSLNLNVFQSVKSFIFGSTTCHSMSFSLPPPTPNFFQILSKGKILSYGTQERINGSSYQSLSFQLTKEMVPSSRLLVYYIVTGEKTAELVADSIWLNIEQKCGNNIVVSKHTVFFIHSCLCPFFNICSILGVSSLHL